MQGQAGQLAFLLASTAYAASVPSERTAHHQALHDAYESSKVNCPLGHAGQIIMLHHGSNLEPEELQTHLQNKGRTSDRFGHVYSKPHGIRGISTRLTEETLEEMMSDGKAHGISGVHADCLRRAELPTPAHVPKAATMLASVQGDDDSKSVYDEGVSALNGVEKAVANWGLTHGSEIVVKDSNYDFELATGEGTVLYPLDTGAKFNHKEFSREGGGTRIIGGWSMGCLDPKDKAQQHDCNTLWCERGDITDEVLGRKNEIPDETMAKAKALHAAGTVNATVSYTAEDRGCDGHGTHTASIVLGNRHGVAKRAEMVVVQALSCIATAQDSMVVKALEMVVEDARARKPYKPAVVLLSLGGEKDVPLNYAVKRTTEHHIPVVVAAGNSHTDSCTTTPSSVAVASTVGAVDEDNNMGSFSSYGRCVDINAPGTGIQAGYAVKGSNDASASLSGTSMAAPFVAGAMLQALALYPQMSNTQVKALIKCVAIKGTVHADAVAAKQTPNLLVHFGKAFASSDNVRDAINESFERGALEAQVQKLAGTKKRGVYALDTSKQTDAMKDSCLKLHELLDETRPEGGVLQNSPAVNNKETVFIDETLVPPDAPEGTPPNADPYTQTATTVKAQGALLP